MSEKGRLTIPWSSIDIPGLRTAVEDGCAAEVEVILVAAAKVHARELSDLLSDRFESRDGEHTRWLTLLSLATRLGHLDVVKVLLGYGVYIEREGDGGETPIMAASWAGQVPMVDLLLAHGADADARDDYGDNALMNASQVGSVEVVRLLLRHNKQDVDAINWDGTTAFAHACACGQTKVVKVLLLEGHCDPDIGWKVKGTRPFDVSHPVIQKMIEDYDSRFYELHRARRVHDLQAQQDTQAMTKPPPYIFDRVRAGSPLPRLCLRDHFGQCHPMPPWAIEEKEPVNLMGGSVWGDGSLAWTRLLFVWNFLTNLCTCGWYRLLEVILHRCAVVLASLAAAGTVPMLLLYPCAATGGLCATLATMVCYLTSGRPWLLLVLLLAGGMTVPPAPYGERLALTLMDGAGLGFHFGKCSLFTAAVLFPLYALGWLIWALVTVEEALGGRVKLKDPWALKRRDYRPARKDPYLPEPGRITAARWCPCGKAGEWLDTRGKLRASVMSMVGLLLHQHLFLALRCVAILRGLEWLFKCMGYAESLDLYILPLLSFLVPMIASCDPCDSLQGHTVTYLGYRDRESYERGKAEENDRHETVRLVVEQLPKDLYDQLMHGLTGRATLHA